MATCLVITSQHLILEPLEAVHAEVLFEGLRDKRLFEFIDDDPPESVESLRTRYARLASRQSSDGAEVWLNWAIRESHTERYVGFVQATLNGSQSALIAYVLFYSAWGKGYAREAVAAMIEWLRDEYGVTTLRATVDPRNRRSIGILQALRFTELEIRHIAPNDHGVVADELEFRREVDPR